MEGKSSLFSSKLNKVCATWYTFSCLTNTSSISRSSSSGVQLHSKAWLPSLTWPSSCQVALPSWAP